MANGDFFQEDVGHAITCDQCGEPHRDCTGLETDAQIFYICADCLICIGHDARRRLAESERQGAANGA